MTRVPFLNLSAAHAEVRQEVELALIAAARSAHYILGPQVDAFEAEFASSVGATYGVGVANGLEALALALKAAGIGPGDEVVVPSHTFIATWLAVTAVGATPVPVDAAPGSFLLDLGAAAEAVGPATAAVIHVHLYGEMVDLGPLRSLCDRYGFFLLEDAAQAHGASLRGQSVGSVGHAAAWSFYPGKNLGALGDAGAVTTDDAALADRIRLMRNYGSSRKYAHDVAGGNSRLDEIQAAVLRVKLRHLEAWNARRRTVADRYDRELRSAHIRLPTRPAEDMAHAWHLYVIRDHRRDLLREELRMRGVETLIHYPVPPHLQGAYCELGHVPGSLPVSELFAGQVLSLPIGPHLRAGEQGSVIEAVQGLR